MKKFIHYKFKDFNKFLQDEKNLEEVKEFSKYIINNLKANPKYHHLINDKVQNSEAKK